MGTGDLPFVIAVIATSVSAMTILAFGFLRRRDAVAWESGVGASGGGTETNAPADPDIARRIASLVQRSDEAAVPDPPAPGADGRPAEATEAWPTEDPTAPDRTPIGTLSVDGLAVATPDPAWPGDAPERGVLARLLVDPLTGLGTELAWDLWIAGEDPRARRYNRPATIVLAELDGLDAVGAFHGPEVAEGAAAMIGAAFRANIRSSDHAAVIRPGLYAVLLTETDEVRAVNFVERVRATCEEWLAANSPGIRIIMGWASPDADGLAGARRLAERRLERERR